MMVIAAEKRPAPGFLNAFDYTKQGQMFDALGLPGVSVPAEPDAFTAKTD